MTQSLAPAAAEAAIVRCFACQNRTGANDAHLAEGLIILCGRCVAARTWTALGRPVVRPAAARLPVVRA